MVAKSSSGPAMVYHIHINGVNAKLEGFEQSIYVFRRYANKISEVHLIVVKRASLVTAHRIALLKTELHNQIILNDARPNCIVSILHIVDTITKSRPPGPFIQLEFIF